MEYRKFRANNILSIVINYVKRLHSGENNLKVISKSFSVKNHH